MSFGQTVLGGLINSLDYTKKVLPYLKEDWFESRPEKEIYKVIKDYVMKYNNSPTMEAVLISLADCQIEENLYDSISETLSKVEYNQLTELNWLIDQTEKWGKERAIYNALMKSISIVDGSEKDAKLDKNAIPQILSDALAVSFQSSIGHDYFEDAEAQYEYYHDPDNRIPFSQDILNRVTRGGVKDSTLNIILAGINVGKSTGLIDLAAQYLEAGKNVVYITMEMSEQVTRSRIDVRLMGLKSEEIENLSKDQYLSSVNKIKAKSRGTLKVKEFPTGAAHIGHFRHALSEMKLKKNFVPDVIIIDYLGITASCKLPLSAKGNTDTYYTAVAEEIRTLAQEFSVPVWTAQQLVRSAQDKDAVSMGDIAKAIGIAATADFMVAMMVPEELIPLKQAICRVLKNRYANRNAIMNFIIGLDNDYQRLYDVNNNSQEALNIVDDIKTSNTNEQINWEY